MKLFAIYAGLGGSFGGATFQYLENFENVDDANDFAESLAREEYESYEGIHGILDQEECEEQDIDYEDEVCSWIDYRVVEIETEEQLMELAEEENMDIDTICHFVTETFHK